MKQEEAISLIKKAIPQSDKPQHWADLGSGGGTFTNALAHLLPNGSHIYAIDKNPQQLPTIMGNNVSVDFIKAGFEETDFNFSNLDGILMANSLHYVKDKKSFVRHWEKYLSNDTMFLIVEYDTTVANPWVPYPISFLNLKTLFTQLHYREVIKVAEHTSIFGQGHLYAAIIRS